jgi:hypothetical protein
MLLWSRCRRAIAIDAMLVADSYEYQSLLIFPYGRGVAHMCACRRGMVPASYEPNGSTTMETNDADPHLHNPFSRHLPRHRFGGARDVADR